MAEIFSHSIDGSEFVGDMRAIVRSELADKIHSARLST